MKLNVETLVLGPLEANCYLVSASEDGPVLIIDPGDRPQDILAKVAGREVCGIVLTHRHSDHIGAVPAIEEATGAPVMTHSDEADAICDPMQNLSGAIALPVTPEFPSRLLEEGDIITIPGGGSEDAHLTVMHTPGHTIGSITLVGEGCCFSGDTLFADGSYGRFDLPTGSEKQLYDSLRRRLGTLPEETVVYPGHGQVTTIGTEKRLNPLMA